MRYLPERLPIQQNQSGGSMTKKEQPKFMESYFIHGDNVSQRWDYSHHLNPPVTESVTFRLESAERGAEGFEIEQFAVIAPLGSVDIEFEGVGADEL